MPLCSIDLRGTWTFEGLEGRAGFLFDNSIKSGDTITRAIGVIGSQCLEGVIVLYDRRGLRHRGESISGVPLHVILEPTYIRMVCREYGRGRRRCVSAVLMEANRHDRLSDEVVGAN